jgi:hypothetical protein
MTLHTPEEWIPLFVIKGSSMPPRNPNEDKEDGDEEDGDEEEEDDQEEEEDEEGEAAQD